MYYGKCLSRSDCFLLPPLPDRVGQYLAHDLPVANCTAVMRLGQHRGLVVPEQADVVTSHKGRIGNFVLGQQEVLPRVAHQKVGLDGLSELDGPGCVGAEDDDIVKVPAILVDGLLWRRLHFSENAAGREHSLDSFRDDAERRQGEVTSEILVIIVSIW